MAQGGRAVSCERGTPVGGRISGMVVRTWNGGSTTNCEIRSLRAKEVSGLGFQGLGIWIRVRAPNLKGFGFEGLRLRVQNSLAFCALNDGR